MGMPPKSCVDIGKGCKFRSKAFLFPLSFLLTAFGSATFLALLSRGERAGKFRVAATVLRFRTGETRGETLGKLCGRRGAILEEDREVRFEEYDGLLEGGGCEDEAGLLEVEELELVFAADDRRAAPVFCEDRGDGRGITDNEAVREGALGVPNNESGGLSGGGRGRGIGRGRGLGLGRGITFVLDPIEFPVPFPAGSRISSSESVSLTLRYRGSFAFAFAFG